LRIRTRLLILISLFMGLMLFIQYYWLSYTQDEALAELNKLTETINVASEFVFFDENNAVDATVEVFDFMPPKRYQSTQKNTLRNNYFFFNDSDVTRHKVIVLEDSLDIPALQRVEVNLDALMDKQVKLDEIEAKLSRIKTERNNSLATTVTVPQPRSFRYTYTARNLSEEFAKARNSNIIVSVILFFLTIGGAFMIARSIEKPVHHLQFGFKAIERGNLNSQLALRGASEFQSLSNSFNAMLDELRKTREKERLLAAKEKLASMGQLAAGVAHEIKNPLNAINLTLSHLTDKYFADSADAQKYFASIQSEVNRLNAVVNQFLNFIRSENLNRQDSNVNQLLSEILTLYEQQFIAQNIELKDQLSLARFNSELDRDQFKTAITNIIVNAIEAMPDGGELYIQSVPEDKTILIRDTGHGIDEETLKSIFDLFYTTKKSGTGLGLPIAYRIIKNHGGELTIKTSAKGTAVWIQL
jgi:signal transduction histidine kinase